MHLVRDVPVIVAVAFAAFALAADAPPTRPDGPDTAAMLSATAPSARLAFTLHPASSMVRIGGPNGIPTPPAERNWSLTVARNEAEAFHVQVRHPGANPNAGPLRVRAEVVPLYAGPEATVNGPAPEIRIYQVLDVNHREPVSNPVFRIPARNLGWIPDVCYPTLEAAAQAHNPGSVTFLFDVSVPESAPPTAASPLRYAISFSETPDGRAARPSARMELAVNIASAALPKRLPFRAGYHWNFGIDAYLGRAPTESERAASIDFSLRHRFTPAYQYNKGPQFTEAEIRRIVDGGGNFFQLFHVGGGGARELTEKQKADLEPKVREWRELMQRTGALDFCYALIADEPDTNAYSVIRRNSDWLKGLFPEIRLWVATRPCAELLDLVDAWDVVTAHSTPYYAPHSFTKESYRLVRDNPGRKAEFWWFFSVEPYAPNANCRLDNELADARAVGWMSHARGIDGFVYFWATDWELNRNLRDVPFPEKAARWNTGLSGAGVLWYPGNDNLPIPSLRLIALRDAMEDWALFRLAGLETDSATPADTRDPARLADLRARAIERLARHAP